MMMDLCLSRLRGWLLDDRRAGRKIRDSRRGTLDGSRDKSSGGRNKHNGLVGLDWRSPDTLSGYRCRLRRRVGEMTLGEGAHLGTVCGLHGSQFRDGGGVDRGTFVGYDSRWC